MDLTVLAIPGYFGSMAYEAAFLKRRAERDGPSAGDYERNDTLASLSMGVGSLVIPLVTKKFANNFEVGRGRWAKPLLATGVAAAAVAAIGDAYRRRNDREAGAIEAIRDQVGEDAAPTVAAEQVAVSRRERSSQLGRKVAGSAAAAAIASIGFSAASTWTAKTTARRLFDKRVLPDLGGGVFGLTAAIVGWDFIYYWNHRLQHESRTMWAIHVVHHSSQRYNLSTALRQPWADALGMFVPYGLLSLLGVRPNLIETARQLNLNYQYWIHTETIRSIGPLESVLNSASHHRVHHGSNRRYLDRNHGSILIIWDKLFGTFQQELDEEPVVYGLTKNIDTFNPLRILTHEYVDIAKDVAGSDNWSDRLSYVLRGPGWAYERNRGRDGGEAVPASTLGAADAVGVA